MFCYKFWELIRMESFLQYSNYFILHKLLVTFLYFLLKILHAETICLIVLFFSKTSYALIFLALLNGWTFSNIQNKYKKPSWVQRDSFEYFSIRFFFFLYNCVWSVLISFITSKLILKSYCLSLIMNDFEWLFVSTAMRFVYKIFHLYNFDEDMSNFWAYKWN